MDDKLSHGLPPVVFVCVCVFLGVGALGGGGGRGRRNSGSHAARIFMGFWDGRAWPAPLHPNQRSEPPLGRVLDLAAPAGPNHATARVNTANDAE